MTVVACATQPAIDDRIATPFAPEANADRGREVFISRDSGHCVLCHEAPGISPAGNVGPSLDRVGSRLTVPQLRLRVADITRVNPDATMPSFHRTEGLSRVAAQYLGRPALSGQQVEDVVAWLATLR
jgi:sulfur-oxidizing protein SoxX